MKTILFLLQFMLVFDWVAYPVEFSVDTVEQVMSDPTHFNSMSP